ncbi:MAG: mismatch repair protein [Candidatus Acidiferrum sp.]
MSDPHGEYSKRLETYLKIVAAKNRLHIRIGNFKLAVVAAGLVLAWFCLHKEALPSYWVLIPVVLYFALAFLHERILRARSRAESAAAFYRRGIARIEDRWTGTGQTGDRFRSPEHVYADDLDLFGPGCLFELLSTARLPMGENRLAKWLCAPPSRATILERQGLVVELREKLDLHRDLAVTGDELRARLNPESLMGWAEGARVMPGIASRIAAIMLALAAVVAIVFYLATLTYWPLLTILLIEVFFRRALRRRAEAVVEGIACNAEGLLLFADILQRLEREPFVSPRLQAFAAELNRHGQPASQLIRKLARIVYWIDAHHSLLGHLLEVPLLYTAQVAFAAESWRRRYGARMRSSIEIVGEIEALLSLATYSYEHPADPFPQLIESQDAPAHFEGQELGHPLIAAAKCVPNSVRLDRETRVLLVSGSNMSGKSTLLRVVGINTVLAMAGAPIRGKSLRLTPLAIGTRIHSTDSLQEGRSTFYTEILHIRRVFDLANGHLPDGDLARDVLVEERRSLLFLFDELLEGTNSKDRRIGAESLIRALLLRRAIGIVTTHDLALTEITAALGDTIRNVHFEDQVEDGKMRFDYKLREGVVTKSNALALMRLIGLEM